MFFKTGFLKFVENYWNDNKFKNIFVQVMFLGIDGNSIY